MSYEYTKTQIISHDVHIIIARYAIEYFLIIRIHPHFKCDILEPMYPNILGPKYDNKIPNLFLLRT